jgi:DNA polymerase III subunit delta'
MARAPILQEVEATPEADRLEGFPHPRTTPVLFGHEAAEAGFAAAFTSGRLHHGWLLAGREGIGKATLAWRIARYALALPGERGNGEFPLDIAPDTVAARQVRALSHPGLLLIRRPWDPKTKRFTTIIPVDEVRRIKSFLAHSTGSDAWRVVLVDSADDLNVNAANALLKSLEEPPPRALFLLVTSEPGRLLTTIRSRCRRLELASLTDTDLRRAATAALTAAEAKPVEDKAWPLLLTSAQGSVRRLLAMSQTEGMGSYGKVIGILGTLPKLDWVAVHSLADEVTGAGSEQRFEQLFAQILEIIARLVRVRAVEAGADADTRLAARIIPAHGLATWAELWETVSSKKAETVGLNLDRKALILEIFAQMQTASRG